MGKNLPPPTTMNAFSQFIESNSAKSKEMKKGEKHLFFNRGSSFLYLETFLLFNCQFYVFLRHDK